MIEKMKMFFTFICRSRVHIGRFAGVAQRAEHARQRESMRIRRRGVACMATAAAVGGSVGGSDAVDADVGDVARVAVRHCVGAACADRLSAADADAVRRASCAQRHRSAFGARWRLRRVGRHCWHDRSIRSRFGSTECYLFFTRCCACMMIFSICS